MTGRVVNLRTRRKQKSRDEKRKAAANGPASGVSKPERDRAEAENRRARDRLDGHRRDDES
jgi:hypothetical protein